MTSGASGHPKGGAVQQRSEHLDRALLAAHVVWDEILIVPQPFPAEAMARTARKASAASNGAAFGSPQLFSAPVLTLPL